MVAHDFDHMDKEALWWRISMRAQYSGVDRDEALALWLSKWKTRNFTELKGEIAVGCLLEHLDTGDSLSQLKREYVGSGYLGQRCCPKVYGHHFSERIGVSDNQYGAYSFRVLLIFSRIQMSISSVSTIINQPFGGACFLCWLNWASV